MSGVKEVVKIYLHCVLLVYLIAFLSVFIQIPGLYSDTGILPIRKVLKYDETPMFKLLSSDQPTLLKYLPKSWNPDTSMSLLCFCGVILSMAAFLVPFLLNCFTFFVLWILYMSLFQVGQVFLWFQWDTLLLELGLLTIILAPLNFNFMPQLLRIHGYHQNIGLWLIRWLAFRLMFCSGVVKLLSGCPTWWGLTALTYHYESQCIPTWLAWFAHHQPIWLHRLSNAFVFIIQIGSSILFFSPFRLHRIISFLLQSFLMVLILLSGNYNFFNIAAIVICLSLVDDIFIHTIFNNKKNKDKKSLDSFYKLYKMIWLFKILVHLIVFSVLLWGAIKYFQMKLDFVNFKIDCNINFSMSDFQKFLQKFVPITICIAGISLLAQILSSIYCALKCEVKYSGKFFSILSCLIHALIALLIFSITLVPYTDIEYNTRNILPQNFKNWFHQSQHLNSFNAYGLFRSMTGVGGRPEVILEGSHHVDKGWEEYHFLYKPGDVYRAPPFVAPHQPRLDWQIWFAALSTYEHHPWFIGLVYRLLQNQQTVKDLMDVSAFSNEPPKYIRAQLYRYHYTDFNETDINAWWRREHVREYLPIVSLQDRNFIDYLRRLNLYEDGPVANLKHGLLDNFVNFLHQLLGHNHGFLICTFIPLVTVAIKWRDLIGGFIGKRFSRKEEAKGFNGSQKIKVK